MFFTAMGAIRGVSEHKDFELDNIKTIAGVSSGSLLAVVLLLGYDWIDLEKYFIERPWEKSLGVQMIRAIASVTPGLCCEKFLRTILDNLFGGANISLNVTLSEFARAKNVRLMFITTKINKSGEFEETTLDSCIHTDLPLIKAIAMSSAVPLLFQPVEWKESVFVDGGLTNNSPVRCGYGEKALSIIIGKDQGAFKPACLLKSPLGYVTVLAKNFAAKRESDPSVEIEICAATGMDLSAWSSSLYDSTKRRKLYQEGYQKGTNQL